MVAARKPRGAWQAHIPRARAMIAAGYVCPCGRGCVPDVDTLAQDLLVQDRVGSRPRDMNISPPRPEARERAADEEPMAQDVCPGCGATMRLPEYLARSLELRKAAWPKCEECRSPRQQTAEWWDR